MDVVPKAGRVLLFQHRGLIHSGDDVTRGTKLTMRTDIMYAKEESSEENGARSRVGQELSGVEQIKAKPYISFD